MYWDVVEIKPVGHLTLQVRFADGLSGRVRFEKSALRGVFAVLSDPARFKQVYVEAGAVTWPGEIDLAPDAMHAWIMESGEWTLS